MINLTQSELTRQERLLIWLYREGITKMQIAKAIGVSPIAVTRWFQSERIPTWRHKQLVAVGIPFVSAPSSMAGTLNCWKGSHTAFSNCIRKIEALASPLWYWL